MATDIPLVLQSAVHIYTDDAVMRYLGAAGLTALVYDNLLTLSEEVDFVWKHPNSRTKSLFIFNRYGVPIILLMTAFGLSLQSTYPTQCRILVVLPGFFGTIFIGTSELLVLMSVAALWEGNKLVVWVSMGGFLLSYGAAVGLMAYTASKVWNTVNYLPITNMCIIVESSREYAGVWASFFAFDVLLTLGSILLNAYSRPRRADVVLLKSLRSDGIIFFMTYTLCHGANLALAATQNPSLTVVVIYLTCALAIIISNRLTLRLRSIEFSPPAWETSWSPI